MIPDLTTEIKRIRHALGAEDDFDIAKIFARLRRAEAESGRTYVRRPPRKPENSAMRQSTEATSPQLDNLSSPSGDR